ncbi:hypothetical protein WJX74_001898 [Apatococcus lobatus]|uniref:Glycosyltransferase 2-like domain-containing protein n=1 Tax=Apatococcus lobatus TaxID=904363 RepID=A0AAW1S4R0_9CHLO
MISAPPPTPLCRIWEEMAAVATQTYGATAFVLLGDDTDLAPFDWTNTITKALDAEPTISCLLLRDSKEPGFPSFPVLRASHLDIFGHIGQDWSRAFTAAGSLVPLAFVNQDADPFLSELYRRVNGVRMLPEITVENRRGGVQVPSQNYTEPSYSRVPVPHELIQKLLDEWSQRLRASKYASSIKATRAELSSADHRHPGVTLQQSYIAVDVLIPSYRASPERLEQLLSASKDVQGASVKFLVQVDNPHVTTTTQAWLDAQQNIMLNKLKVRRNTINMGAGLTRNTLLDNSHAEYVIMFDDDVIPMADTLQAYVNAFKAHPNAAGFAGPSYLPHEATLLASAIHLSDVSFFWEAAADPAFEKLPWAVTANMAFKKSSLKGVRFQPNFPKTGGGEDIDFCLQIGKPPALVSVPDAAVSHPLWSGGRYEAYKHPFCWAYGDGELIDLHPGLTYRCAPNVVETIFITAVVGLPMSIVWSEFPLKAVTALPLLLIVEACFEIFRNCVLKERLQKHRDVYGLKRVVASMESSLIRDASELGRLLGHLHRWRPQNIGKRFDWFCGTLTSVVREEQMKALFRFASYVAVGTMACLLI